MKPCGACGGTGFVPSLEMAERLSCRNMIENLEAAGHGHEITDEERRYAYAN